MVEARVPLPGPVRLRGIDLVQILDHRLDRRPQAVEVEPVETGLGGRVPLRVVAGPEPLDEAQDVAVAPHPGGKSKEPLQGGIGVRVARHPHHVSVHPVRIGPVPLNGDHGEAQLVDESPGDTGTLAVELMGPVRRLSDEYQPTVADQVHERVVVGAGPGDRAGHRTQGIGQRPAGRFLHRTRVCPSGPVVQGRKPFCRQENPAPLVANPPRREWTVATSRFVRCADGQPQSGRTPIRLASLRTAVRGGAYVH